MHQTPVETQLSDEAIEWFSKLNSGQATPEDRGRFEAWRKLSPVNAQAYADVEKFWALLDEPAQRVFEQEEARGGMKPRAARPHCKAVSPFFGKPLGRALAGLSLAAVLAVYLGLPGALRFWNADYRTPWGERLDVTLEDGSRVTLNTHSALSVEFTPERRMVKLVEGEAYFQVKHNPTRPFVVGTTYGVVQVTGTAFNVYQQNERMTVTVSEGRVRVYTKGAEHQAVELTAGLQSSADARGIGPGMRVDTRQALVWRQGLMVFNLQPLSAVVDELNRYLPAKIVVADPRIGTRIVSGAFDLTQPRDILSAIEKTLGLSTLNLSGALTLIYQPAL